jgi:hypothetical protein
MAKLAGKAAPSTAPWFWGKAGIDWEAFQDLSPEFERLARESEKRITGVVKDAGGQFIPVPVMHPSLDHHASGLACPEIVGTEEWISVQKAVVRAEAGAYAQEFRWSLWPCSQTAGVLSHEWPSLSFRQCAPRQDEDIVFQRLSSR